MLSNVLDCEFICVVPLVPFASRRYFIHCLLLGDFKGAWSLQVSKHGLFPQESTFYFFLRGKYFVSNLLPCLWKSWELENIDAERGVARDTGAFALNAHHRLRWVWVLKGSATCSPCDTTRTWRAAKGAFPPLCPLDGTRSLISWTQKIPLRFVQ